MGIDPHLQLRELLPRKLAYEPVSEEHFTPDFITIPYQIIIDTELQPLDRLVYGVIYWIEHFKEGVCRASNNYIAGILHCSAKGVANALTTLENRGYIKRSYQDDAQTVRKHIKCRIYLRKVSSTDGGVSSTEEQINKLNISKDIFEPPLNQKQVIHHYSNEFKRVFNANAPTIMWGKVGALLKRVKIPQETLLWMISEFLKDVYSADKQFRPSPDLATLLGSKYFNKYLSMAPDLKKLEKARLDNETRKNCKKCNGTGFVDAGEMRVRECKHE